MTTRWLAIVGIGEDGHLPPAAHDAVARAALVVGGRRHLALAEAAITGEKLPWPSPMDGAYATILARRPGPVAVLASGDPFCFGVGTALARLVPMAEIICHPAPSAFALARARLGWSTVEELSVCGRPLTAIVPHLQPGARLLVLSADASSPGALAALLQARGLGESEIIVLEAMGGLAERMRHATAQGFDLEDVHALNTVAITVKGPVTQHLATGLSDSLFEHDGQLTRREIRAVTLSSLAPRRGELLWDVGGGAGSIGIEWMLRHPANRAIAIEPDLARVARIAQNATTLGVPGLVVVEGGAPGALAGLPPPDAIFLGGGAHRPGVIDTAWGALPPQGRIVANAVTIETEMTVMAAQSRLGGTLLRLSLERMDSVGTMHAFRPAMTVTQWAAVKP
ncbi:precorrin-6y C5,15-methyltransferase (decarboxylating) subunit CbiE [Acidisphaera sp. L21]|uniref:precorrin-6y C5,15-methyltransferase (decarboxylating) subunit CbiE n=1 Tax=Acidisphaera sp. L21 TaxID=1641851 RepID=UPI00131D1B0D|nr:precorrin-6y C5,15-methyltransferase (decarboxylating) subunit CbiE [Acidisphaera sp. L21]